MITRDYRGLKGFKNVKRDYKSLQWVTRRYTRLQGITRG